MGEALPLDSRMAGGTQLAAAALNAAAVARGQCGRHTAMLGLKELHVSVEENHPADDCMEACAWCELACLAATEACLNDLREEQLGLCLQLSLDCAEICWTTRKFLADALVVAPALVREQLESCALICAACAVECRRHAEFSYQLTACSRSCARAEQLCRDMQLRVAKLD
jgi:hypothetical protein